MSICHKIIASTNTVIGQLQDTATFSDGIVSSTELHQSRCPAQLQLCNDCSRLWVCHRTNSNSNEATESTSSGGCFRLFVLSLFLGSDHPVHQDRENDLQGVGCDKWEDTAICRTRSRCYAANPSLFRQYFAFLVYLVAGERVLVVAISEVAGIEETVLEVMVGYRRFLCNCEKFVTLSGFILILLQTFVGAVISHFTSCSSMSAWFTVGGCATPRDSRAQIISLYYAFAVDVLSDLMVMILPIGLVWNLQMSFTKKTGIVALFCVGLVAIATAIIRVVSIGVRAGSSTPSSTWLAFWGIIETGVAVIIGTAPGLYSTARTAHTSRKESKYVGHHNGYLRHTGDLPSNHSEGIKSKTTSNPLSTVSFDDDEQGIVQQSTVSGKSADQTTLFSRPSYLQPTTKTTNRELDDSMEMTPRSEWSSSNIFITKNFAVKKW